MEDVQKELLAISAALIALTKKVESIVETIEKGSGLAAPAKKVKTMKKASAPAKKKPVKAKKKSAPKRKTAKRPSSSTPVDKTSVAAENSTMLEDIFGIISRSRNGISVVNLKKRTALEARQVSNALYKLTKKGKIETIARGVYIKKKK